MDLDDRITESLRKNGYKATPQRISVARCILTSRDHPTAEIIFNQVQREHPTISLSTVYNTLHMLQDLDMLHELGFNDVGVRYDPNTKPHVNLVCRSCGRIIDVDEPLIEEALNHVEEKLGFKRSGQQIDVYGYCKRCSKEDDEEILN